jgi:hypothetical protein
MTHSENLDAVVGDAEGRTGLQMYEKTISWLALNFMSADVLVSANTF